MAAPKYQLVTLPSVFGAEWRTEESGTRYQFVAIRGTTRVTMAIRAKDSDEWLSTAVDQPERFGPLPFKNAKAFRAWVDAFFAAADEES